MFRHHPDGWIVIDDVTAPLTAFLKLAPEYKLPEGATGREYDGQRHVIYTAESQFGGPLPWPEGEQYMTLKDRLAELIKPEVVEPRVPDQTCCKEDGTPLNRVPPPRGQKDVKHVH